MLVAFVSACGSGPIRQLTETQLLEDRDAFLHAYQADLALMAQQSEARIQAEYQEAQNDPGARQSYDILMLSGGGAFGAFGAGFLDGWGEVEDEEFRRPEFDTVSGISTGALIAPFAFTGTPESYQAIVSLYENPGPDWVRKKGVLAMLTGDPSLYDISKLQAKVRDVVTPELVSTIAQAAAEHRQLLVGATNADYGQMRVWDLAQDASTMPIDLATDQMASVLLASTAIPGAFPPILIGDNLYVDGGAAMQFVGGIDEREWAYFPEAGSIESTSDGPPVRIRVWVVVNQKLLPEPSVVELNWATITARSASTLIRTSTLQSIQDAETYVRLINRLPGIDAQMRYVAMPQEFEIPKSEQMFHPETMRALVELGYQMGSDPKSWRTGALRPGAPFQVHGDK